jgi:hypothetical protein
MKRLSDKMSGVDDAAIDTVANTLRAVVALF